jgi:hypothetical protein
MIEKNASQVDFHKTNQFVLHDAWMHHDNIIFNKNMQNYPVYFAHLCEILARRQSLAYTWDTTTFVILTELEYYCKK